MSPEEIDIYRKSYFNALCEQSKGAEWNMTQDKLEAEFRHLAFEKPDEYIEGLALYYTPEEAAAEELQ